MVKNCGSGLGSLVPQTVSETIGPLIKYPSRFVCTQEMGKMVPQHCANTNEAGDDAGCVVSTQQDMAGTPRLSIESLPTNSRLGLEWKPLGQLQEGPPLQISMNTTPQRSSEVPQQCLQTSQHHPVVRNWAWSPRGQWPGELTCSSREGPCHTRAHGHTTPPQSPW